MMSSPTSLLLLLVPLGPLLAVPQDAAQDPPPPAAERQAELSYEALLAEFDAQDDELKAARKAAESTDERRSLRAERKALPALFWPRMEAAADAGQGRALLWMAQHARKAGIPKAELGQTKHALYTRVLEEHMAADWLGEALTRIASDRRDLGTERVVELLSSVHGSDAAEDTRTEAAFLIAGTYEKDKDDASAAKAVAWYRRIAEEFPDTNRGREADDRIFQLEHLQIGMVAPDIVGPDLDGVEFKLSDYRGKVIVLDFWGDW